MLKISSNYKIIKVCRSLTNSVALSRSRRTFCTLNHETNSIKEPLNFDQMNQFRQCEARRSILVQVNSEKSFDELQRYCGQIGNIISAHHYCVTDENAHYILLEFKNAEEVDGVLAASAFNQEDRGIPTKSHFLWFRTGPKVKIEQKSKSSAEKNKLNVTNGHVQMTNEKLMQMLGKAESLEKQMNIVYDVTQLSDLGKRLRFLAAQQVQDSLVGMFPNAFAHPFGSSVNGFGKQGCDLDMVLQLRAEKYDMKDSRLIFHTKEVLNERTQTQHFMGSIADLLQLYLPGVNNVRRILHARVPLIKYFHEYLNIEIDLSMSNHSGIYMSELLYMFGKMDPRVAPLVFCIRRWAQCTGLTNATPGNWISNFSLTVLVLFFLQTLKQPILPSVNYLIQKAREEDKRDTEDSINSTFLRDLHALDFTTKNTSSVDVLLMEFFEYFACFDFSKRGISLNEAKCITKPDHSSMYIVNPLEPHLNVSKNLSFRETERFCTEVQNAAWLLEYDMQTKGKSGKPWGLLNLFKKHKPPPLNLEKNFSTRLLKVSDLFQMEESPELHIEYKNENMKTIVKKITNKSKRDLNNIQKQIDGNDNSKPINLLDLKNR